jgi:voltage-gated potassium channel Kch
MSNSSYSRRTVAPNFLVLPAIVVAPVFSVNSISRRSDAGEPVLFGDADNAALLRAAGLERARALVVSFDNERYAQRIVHAKRQALPILVRATKPHWNAC